MAFKAVLSRQSGFTYSRRAHCAGLLAAALGVPFRSATARELAPECPEGQGDSWRDMTQFLAAARPNGSIGHGAEVFDHFVGHWELDCTYFDAEGGVRRTAGEWHFGWILGGLAMQDVLYFYPPGQRPNHPANLRGGTTVRVFDATTKQWTVTWNNAAAGWAITLHGGAVGDRIVLMGVDIDGSALRWSFNDISADQFLWRGEISKDDGTTWRLEQEMTVRRSKLLRVANARVLHPVWERLDGPGLEAADVRIGSESIEWQGTVVLMMDRQTACLRYALTCSPAWEFMRGDIEIVNAGEKRRLHIERTTGQWFCNGTLRPDLVACRDVDIMGTPATNSLPIRRLVWAPNEPHALQTAFVRLPSLDVRPEYQRYTRLTDTIDEVTPFLYENVRSGFRAELAIDSDGLVVSYPAHWRRVPGAADRRTSNG
jgi:hypothetical protein